MIEIGFNVFRHRAFEDLCCAVPEDQVVPGFLAEERWHYVRVLRDEDGMAGFAPRPALEGARRNGFYLYQEAR